MYSATQLKHYSRLISFCIISWIKLRSEVTVPALKVCSLWQLLQGSSSTNLNNMKGLIYFWLSQLYFNDLNSSLYAAKYFALFGLQLGSDITDL